MANMKPFLSLLTTAPLLLTSLQSMAEDEDEDVSVLEPTSTTEEDTVETTLIKSKFSFDFIGLQSDYYESSGARLGLGFQPSEDSGVIMNLALEHFSDVTYVLSPTKFESQFTNLRWSAGYKFDVGNDFNITPSLGLVTNLAELDANTSQGYTNVRFAYDVTDSFSLFMESTYDFGSTVLSDSGTVGIGFKYTPHYSQPVVSLVDDEPAPLPDPEPLVSELDSTAPVLVTDLETSSVTGIIDGVALGDGLEIVEEVAIVEDVVESDDYENMPLTIQIGVFRNMAAVNTFRQQNSINADETFTREVNGLVKIYYKGYETRVSANQNLASLKMKGVDGFVLNTPEKTNNKFVAIGTFYAVQLGSFSSLSSADPIINKMQGLDKQTFIKQSGELMKLYTGKFQSNSEAQAEVRKLKANNINGFVTKIN